MNLDLAKTFYSKEVERDSHIPDTIVRTSTIPEELGRISYLFCDKTGSVKGNIQQILKRRGEGREGTTTDSDKPHMH